QCPLRCSSRNPNDGGYDHEFTRDPALCELGIRWTRTCAQPDYRKISTKPATTSVPWNGSGAQPNVPLIVCLNELRDSDIFFPEPRPQSSSSMMAIDGQTWIASSLHAGSTTKPAVTLCCGGRVQSRS